MTFYDNFQSNKKKHRLNNQMIGEVIDMKPDALRMAIVKQSLSRFHIAEIEKIFGHDPAAEITNEFIDALFKNDYFKTKLAKYIVSKYKPNQQ